MSHPGMGVMIGMLGGNGDSVEAYKGALGKTIKSAELRKEEGDGAFYLWFEDGTGLRASDEGRSCCESRYMVCDDDLYAFTGAKLIEGELMSGPEITDEYGEVQESQFLKFKTDKGNIVISNHNEHNGYYGGFWLVFSTATLP